MDLQQEVAAELCWDVKLRDMAIAVRVDGAVVTLTGDVPSESARRAGELAAYRVRGVKAVINDIRVNPPAPYADDDLSRIATQHLSCLAMLPSGAVQVTARAGWLTLTGEVAWQYQRVGAEHVVSQIRGVTGVTNEISILPAEKTACARQQIEAALQRCASLDAQWITIEAYRGSVVLRGWVRSWLERGQAEAIAWSAPGVVEVANHLTILS